MSLDRQIYYRDGVIDSPHTVLNDLETLSDAIELVMDEFQAWDKDASILRMRLDSHEVDALVKLREAYESVHASAVTQPADEKEGR